MASTSVALVAWLVAAPPGWHPILHAQTPPTTRGFIVALDAIDTPLDLDPSQISMVFDGVPCSPVTLERISRPAKLSLLVDNSLDQSSFSDMREALRQFLSELPNGLQTSLVTLAPQPRWIQGPTDNGQNVLRAVDRIIPDRGFPKFLDGLAEAADRIDRDPDEAFVTIVVLTTDTPDSSGGNRAGTLVRLREQLRRRSAAVHVLGMLGAGQRRPAASGPLGRGTEWVPESGGPQPEVGRAITKETGGRYEQVTLTSTIRTVLPEYGRLVARRHAIQNAQYHITCANPPSSAKQVSVFTSHPRAVRAIVTANGHIRFD
jgi:hypothetical protein